MIAAFVSYIETVLLPLGAWGVFLATLIEQIIAPIPSAFVQLSGGFFLIDTSSFLIALYRVMLLVALPSAVAVVLGSLLVYYISYVAGKKIVDRWGAFLRVRWSDIELLQERFKHSRKDDVLLLLLRSLPAVPTVAVDIFCGVVRYHLGRYMIITFIGTFFRATVFGLLGWRVGNIYVTYAEYIARIEKYLLVGILLAVVVFIIIRTKRSKDL